MIAGLFYFSKEWRGAVKKAESTHKYFSGVCVREGESMWHVSAGLQSLVYSPQYVGVTAFFTSVGIPFLGSSTTIASSFTY